MTAAFGAEDVRVGEALFRSEGHCLAACELYGAGRRPDALLQAARPITDVLPWLETELRSSREALHSFMRAVSKIGGEIRKGSRPRVVRRGLKGVSASRSALLDDAVGEAAGTDVYLASVSVALLETLRTSYSGAVASQDLNGYQTAYGTAHVAVELLDRSGVGRISSIADPRAVLEAAFPSIDPPEGLWRPETLSRAIDEVRRIASEVGASATRPTLGDALVKVDRLLDDVVGSYSEGVAPLAARLAASLYVRSYDPIRADLAAVDPVLEERATALLGIDLRRAINENAPLERVEEIVADVRLVLAPAAEGSEEGERGERGDR